MRRPFALLAPLALAVLLPACNKVTVDNYNRLTVGMSFEEVRALLGPPDRCSDVMTVKHCTWGNDKRYIDVNFVADKAVLFNAENIR